MIKGTMESFSMNNKIIVFSFWCVILLCCSDSGEGMVKLPGNETVPAVIFFGDSIVDTGSNNDLMTMTKCNFFPYGRDFLGAKPTGRFSNGKVPSDFIAEELGIKELVPSYRDASLQPSDLLTGVNFASGGSGYDPFTSQMMSVIPLSVQLDQFKEYIGKLKINYGEERTNFILSKSIVFVVASSNDIGNSYYASGIRKAEYDINIYTDMLVQFASSFIKEIYGLGARRMGVFSAAPLGCVPFQRTLFGGAERECVQEINSASKLYNSKLYSELNYLNNNTLPQAKVVYIDVYTPLLDIIQNAATYGFEVVDKGCCGTGTMEVAVLCNRLDPKMCTDDSKYVFWDSYHPTQTTYQMLVAKVLNKYLHSFF